MNALDAISETLGAATPVATIPRPSMESKDLVEQKDAPEIEDDYQEARSNLKELISQAMEYIPEVVELTRQAQSDKMINAMANLLNTAANLNINLSKLSKEIKQTPKQGKVVNGQAIEQEGTVHQTTNVFVGSTEEFLDMMEDRKKRKAEEAAAAASVIDGECTIIEP